MSYSAEEEKLYRWARDAVPRWFFARARAEEDMGALVKIFDAARQVESANVPQTKIRTATGIWLEEHARDRGTQRRVDETDEVLRERLLAAGQTDIIAIVNMMLAADGLPETAAMVELRRDRMHWARNFWSRGYRYTVRYPGTAGALTYPHAFIVLLPYGTSDELLAAVEELVRAARPSGFRATVRRRLSP